MIEKRNMAASEVLMMRPAQAQWTDWTVRKAVREGYRASSWVYRAVSLIAGNAAAVPWVVYGADNEAIWDHPLSKLLSQPNPHFTRQQFFELLIGWLALAGNAYVKRIEVRGATAELWPVSPDRIAPRPSADPTKWIDGYEILDERGVKRMSVDYTTENVIHALLADPANPYVGIAPLMAAARAADLDNSAQDWNVAVMQNRAVPDGLFSFKRNLDGGLIKTLVERIKERWSGTGKAREPMVIGDEATYTRMGLTPVELDYLNSRKFSREETYIVYGIPPQLGGSQEASTYNNFATSNRIFWEATLIPTYLNRIKGALNASLAAELAPGQWIGYDLSNVAAMVENETERATTAKLYVDMGVPLSQVNEKFELGLKPWDGWDKPAPIKGQSGQPAADAGQRARPRLLAMERRNLDAEMASRDAYAEGPLQAAIAHLLDDDRKAVFAALENGQEPGEAAKESRKAWQAVLDKAFKAGAYDAAARMLGDHRGAPMADLERRDMQKPDEATQKAIDDALAQEAVVLTELSHIAETTVSMIVTQVTEAVQHLASGDMLPISAIQQALTDTGVFSPERALRIARTVAGTAMSVGQMEAGRSTGATHKIWHTGGINVRDWHSARAGEKVKIDGRFSARAGSSVGPRYPCDPQVSGADRINCFLPGTDIRGNVLGAQRARYKGHAVEIVTRGGRVLRVTDHHPVLTENGFVFAGQIQVGDKLLCCVVDDNGPDAAVVANEDHQPTKIEQVFGALAELDLTELPRRSADDFYGDGQSIDGDIEVVWADRKLLSARKAALAQSTGQLGLVSENLETAGLNGDGAGSPDGNAVAAGAATIPSGTALSRYAAIQGTNSLPCEGRRFGLGARLNAAFAQLTINGAPADAEALGERIGGFARTVSGNDLGGDLGSNPAPALECPQFAPLLQSQGAYAVALKGVMDGSGRDAEAVRYFLHRNEGTIEIDDVIVAAGFVHDGYVYDVMTSNGIAAGNDILTSNCKCAMSFSIED